MSYKKRSTEEYIILSISSVSALCIFPFFIIRTINNDWSLAVLDMFAVLSTAILFSYVYVSGRVKFAGFFLAFLCIALVIGTITIKGAEQLLWTYPSLIGLFFLIKPKIALAITLTLITGIGAGLFLTNGITYIALLQYLLSSVITVLFSFAFSDRMLRQQTLLRELSIKDPLTGVNNRRAMEERLLNITASCSESLTISPSLILIDLDEFRRINDQHGHNKGNNVLRELSHIISSRLTSNETLYRVDGEEFVIICDNINSQETSSLAEDLREIIEGHTFDNQIKLTISIGIAQYQINETGFEWLHRADKAMKRAKNAGSNFCFVDV